MTETALYPPGTKTHLALAVRDLNASLEFYKTLLGQDPAKVHPGYAKFSVENPPLSLALNETESARGASLPAHYGIQVPDAERVEAMAGRLRKAGLKTVEEDGVTCCYAVQDKVWAEDPDGNQWEVYVVLEDTLDATEATQEDAPCCTPECCQP